MGIEAINEINKTHSDETQVENIDYVPSSEKGLVYFYRIQTITNEDFKIGNSDRQIVFLNNVYKRDYKMAGLEMNTKELASGQTKGFYRALLKKTIELDKNVDFLQQGNWLASFFEPITYDNVNTIEIFMVNSLKDKYGFLPDEGDYDDAFQVATKYGEREFAENELKDNSVKEVILNSIGTFQAQSGELIHIVPEPLPEGKIDINNIKIKMQRETLVGQINVSYLNEQGDRTESRVFSTEKVFMPLKVGVDEAGAISTIYPDWFCKYALRFEDVMSYADSSNQEQSLDRILAINDDDNWEDIVLQPNSRLMNSTIQVNFDDAGTQNYSFDLVGSLEEDEKKMPYINGFYSYAGIKHYSSAGISHYYNNNNVKIADNKVNNNTEFNYQQKHKGTIAFSQNIGIVRYIENGISKTEPFARVKQANINTYAKVQGFWNVKSGGGFGDLYNRNILYNDYLPKTSTPLGTDGYWSISTGTIFFPLAFSRPAPFNAPYTYVYNQLQSLPEEYDMEQWGEQTCKQNDPKIQFAMNGAIKKQVGLGLASGKEDNNIIIQKYTGALKEELINFLKIIVSICDAAQAGFSGALYAQSGALPLNNMARIKNIIVDGGGNLQNAIDKIINKIFSIIVIDNKNKQKVDTFTKLILSLGDRIKSSHNIDGGFNFNHKAIMPFTLKLTSQSTRKNATDFTQNELTALEQILGAGTIQNFVLDENGASTEEQDTSMYWLSDLFAYAESKYFDWDTETQGGIPQMVNVRPKTLNLDTPRVISDPFMQDFKHDIISDVLDEETTMVKPIDIKLNTPIAKKYITYIPINENEINTILSMFGNPQAFILNKGKLKSLLSNLEPLELTLSTEPYSEEQQKLYSIDITGINLAGYADITLQFLQDEEQPKQIILNNVPLGNKHDESISKTTLLF